MVMFSFDFFEFYRFMLGALLSIYTLLQIVLFVWRWQGPGGEARMGSRLAYRYAEALFFGIRVRRFAYEFAVIAGLLVIFLLLIRAHP